MMLEIYVVAIVFFLTALSIFVNQGVIENRYLRFLDIPYHLSPVLGAALIYLLGVINLFDVYTGLTGVSVSEGLTFLSYSGPYSAAVLFLSIALVSLSLEVSGFFRYLAVKILEVVEGSGVWLFVAVFWVTAFFALFTSNDIIILLFTPFLLHFLRLVDLDSSPYLIAEFFAANIFSMVMLIGNETNIIAATAHGIAFIEHIQFLILPGIIGGSATFAALYFLFRNNIHVNYETENLPEVSLNRWELLSSLLLISTLLSLGFLSMQGYLLWHIGFFWAALTVILFVLPDLLEQWFNDLDRKPYLYSINEKMPWEVVPFLFGFFVIVYSFEVTGLTPWLTEILNSLLGGSIFSTVFGIGLLSAITANMVNNIPMTVLFSDILAGYGTGDVRTAAVFSLIIGSNIGANITPIGALAGILWFKMVNHDKKRVTFKQFLSTGLKVTSVTALASLTTLYLVIII